MKDEIEEIYKNSGYNTDSVKKHVKRMTHKGYDESFDGSLLVVYFEKFTAIVGTSHLNIVGA